ncbi:hypothetical protein [Streptomyces sp. AHA2]|uniref:hypothetical protein n=1 Tax=Streptomyces sp. AHA2 TaxID=3064526 RepID=UPI002FE20534
MIDPDPGPTQPSSVGVPDRRQRKSEADNAPHGIDRHLVACTVAAPAHRPGRVEHAVSEDDGAASGTRFGPVQADRAPGGRSDGVLGNRSTADQGTARHGAPHALAPGLHVPLRGVPGSQARRTDAAGVRDAQRDVPLFPG